MIRLKVLYSFMAIFADFCDESDRHRRLIAHFSFSTK